MQKTTFIPLMVILITAAVGLAYYSKVKTNNNIAELDNPQIQQVERKNQQIIEENLTNAEDKVFDNKDISYLADEEIVTDVQDVVDVPFDTSINDFMLEFIPHKELELYNVNTKEKIDTVFWVAGDYVPDALDDLDQFMRDWRRNQVIDIDPELYELLYDLHDEFDADAPIHLISGHRSEKTNTSLRKMGRKTAKKSQHVLGKAADITIPGVPVKELKEEALDLEVGGVGYYANDNFVHVDTGRVRQWSEK